MRFAVVVLASLFVGIPDLDAASSNPKLAFWDQQRKGANGDGGSDPERWFEAAADVGIEFVRLSPAVWSGVGRDFLLGDADGLEGIPESDLLRLIDVLDIAEEHGMKIVLTMFSLPGARWRQQNDNQFDYRLWHSGDFQDQAGAFWANLAGRLRYHPALVGYTPLNEPHPAREAGLEDNAGGQFDRWLRDNRNGSADLNTFNARMVEAIRSADPVTPIILEGWFHASALGLSYLARLDDPAVLYAFHFYEPWVYTTYRVNQGRYEFPERMPAGDSGELQVWTGRQFSDRLQPVIEWSRRLGIPSTRIIAAEFGCDRRVPGAQGYLTELIAQLNTHGWHWAFYSFRAPDWDGLDYELGTEKLDWKYWQEREKGVDHERLIERRDNPLWEVLKSEFSPFPASSSDE